MFHPRGRRNLGRSTSVLLLLLALIVAACGGGDGGNESETPAQTETTGSEAPATTAGGEEDGDTTESTAAEESGELTPVEIVVFNPPSLGAFLPAVIEARGIDEAHGLTIEFVQRPPDAYNTEFASGQFKVGGSAALLSEALRATRGVEVAYLFNLHDFWGAVVSTTPEVQSLADLSGRSLAAATSTTNYAMFQWFALQQGADLSDVTVENTATPGLVTQALTGRSDAVQLWEPAYSTLMAQAEGSDLTTLDMGLEAWEEKFGISDIPYLGVAAHYDWINENQGIIDDLQAVYEEAAEWSLANPEEAAEIIAATMPEGTESEPLVDLLANNDRLGLNVRSAAEVADGIRSVFEAGLEIGYFEELPPDSVIYGLDR